MRILVVEDDPDSTTVVGDGLRHAGYGVTVATDGGDGFLDARLNAYDLVVLDLTLPTMEGIEVARRLRAAGIATPILILTARRRAGHDRRPRRRRRRLPDQALWPRRVAGPRARCCGVRTRRGRVCCAWATWSSTW